MEKDDNNKLKIELVSIGILSELAKIRAYGIKKYDADSWRAIDKSRLYAALMRHIIAWREGEMYDKESKMPHLSHALCNMMFLMQKEGIIK